MATVATPSLNEINEHVEHDLTDEAIQRLIDDAEDDILSRFGPHATQVEDVVGGGIYVFPRRRISTVTSIVETSNEEDTTLATNDYKIMNNGWQLKRLTNGSNGRNTWAPEVRLTYTPVAEADQRKRVIIDLVRLAVQHNALSREVSGDHESQSVEYQKERERILAGLQSRQRILA